MIAQQGRGQARLPVVAVQYLGAPAQGRQAECDARHYPTEEQEALGIVTPVAPGEVGIGAPLAAEVIRGLDQIDREPGVWEMATKDADPLMAALDADLAQGLKFANLFYRLRIGWDNQPGVVPQLDQGRREAGSHIGQAAGLDEGMGLAAGHEDTEPIGPCLGPLTGPDLTPGLGLALAGGPRGGRRRLHGCLWTSRLG